MTSIVGYNKGLGVLFYEFIIDQSRVIDKFNLISRLHKVL